MSTMKQAEAPTHQPSTRLAKTNFTLADAGYGELICAGPTSGEGSKNFTLTEAGAADVLPGGMFRQDEGRDDGTLVGFGSIADLPDDLLDEFKKKLEEELDEWRDAVDEGSPFIGDKDVDDEVRKLQDEGILEANPQEGARLIPSAEGGCRGEELIRWLRVLGESRVEVGCWLAGGYVTYAKDSPVDKNGETIESVTKDENGETIREAAQRKYREINRNCKELIGRLASADRESKQDIGQMLDSFLNANGLPPEIGDAAIREQISGITCQDPEECEVTYEILASGVTIGPTVSRDIRSDCSLVPVELEGGEEERNGIDKNGRPIKVRLRTVVLFYCMYVQLDWVLHAIIKIYCRSKAR